jgi:hypothetical protein
MTELAPRILPNPPDELTNGKLRRIGEGIGKIVYASEHWVVKRERKPPEIVALIVLWRLLRKAEKILPWNIGERMLSKPSRQIRVLRLMIQAAMAVVPQAIWFPAHIKGIWKQYHFRSVRGERLARTHLSGTEYVPESVQFPSTRVRVKGWPGWLVVSEATQRVEATLYQRLVELSKAERFEELEQWLERFLDLRLSAWRLGVFSVDAHLKNFGVAGDRIVLLDTGGLTDRWHDIENRLAFEEVVTQPHIQLGLGPVLGSRPDIAERFDERWKAIVNRDVIKQLWPSDVETATAVAGSRDRTDRRD